MSDAHDSMKMAVSVLRSRITGALPLMMRAAMEPFDDETIWWKPAEGVNPVAVLALHCAGNLRHATVHLSLHVGQAVQLAKLRGNQLSPTVWVDAHRASGASRS